LTPNDFGLFGIALLSMATIESLSELGIKRTLIQAKDDIGSCLNTAWSVQIVRGIVQFSILFSVAPYIARLFGEPDAVFLLQAISVLALLRGFENIGVVYFYKKIEFQKQFVFETPSALIDLVVTVLAAVILKSALALIIGALAGGVARVALSYLLHPHRPKVEFRHSALSKLYGFGRWVFGSQIVTFLGKRIPDYAVGILSNASSLGLFVVARSCSNSAIYEPMRMTNRVAFPIFSEIQSDKDRVKRNFFRVFRLTLLVVVPASIGLVCLAEEFTFVFLGEKWMSMVTAFQILSIAAMFQMVVATGTSLYYGTGYPKYELYSQLSRILPLIVLIWPLTLHWDIAGAASATLVSFVLAVVLFFFLTSRIFSVSFESYCESLCPPIAASLVMAFGLIELKRAFNVLQAQTFFHSAFLFLALLVSGFLIYSFLIYLLNKIFARFNNLEDLSLVFNSLSKTN
jgi:O-antigen/teichoic acid export membrane protein